MGFHSVAPFFAYYFDDVVGAANPALMTSVLIGLTIVTSIPCAMVSGALSDQYGRKNLVYISTVIMGVAHVLFGILSLYPSLGGSFGVACFLGVGYGIYTAVDWALAIDCLPPNSDVAKDLGIWQLSILLPQLIAPVIGGGILNTVRDRYTVNTGYFVFFLVSSLWYAAAFVCTYFLRVPQKTSRQSLPSQNSTTLL